MSYQIIDEPRVRTWGEHIIVHPILILFVSIFIPLFITLPFYGRFWMPFAWLALNSFALGSATLKREVITCVLSVVALIGVTFSAGLLLQYIDAAPEIVAPYYRIALMGVLFFAIYLVVYPQERSYEIYQYLRSGQNAGWTTALTSPSILTSGVSTTRRWISCGSF